MRRFQIIVEGDADKKFFEDYYHHIFGGKAPQGSIVHPGKGSKTGGYQKLRSEDAIGAMRQNADLGGVNLVIFDADEDIETRRAELLAIKDEFGVEFELFLLPNDKDAGALEDMLENIINPNNEPIFKCWDKYESDLGQLIIKGRTTPLTIPGKKAKIYAYLSALLGKSDDEQKLAQTEKRDYRNPLHWNLDAEYLEPLREFLKCNIEKDE